MRQVNYSTISDQELKQYWRAHPHDQEVQQAYFDRLNQTPRPVITKIGDPDFDAKLQQEIERQMNLAKG
jgi:hypothetical protein